MKKLTHAEILGERLTPKEAMLAERNPVSVIASNIRSLYNVGSLFRTCDSARTRELILCGFTPSPPRKEILKTALGSVDSVPWQYFDSTLDAIKDQKNKGYKVIAVELTDKKRSYSSLEKKEYPVCLVVGNELTGLDDEIVAQCDDAIEIPMHGVKHSLNVSVATGIVLFEAIRIWHI
jgi:23S rRNA (guanosine2251-2'-O)-methyltransferase